MTDSRGFLEAVGRGGRERGRRRGEGIFRSGGGRERGVGEETHITTKPEVTFP